MINIFEIPNMADILPEYKVHYQNIFYSTEYGDRENVQAMTDYSIMNGTKRCHRCTIGVP